MSISEHITASGLSRAKICELTGMSAAMLSMIEKGDRRPGPRSAMALAAALGIKLEILRPDLAAMFKDESAA
jgi:transcriptional regulator with XRE-family HTH domain